MFRILLLSILFPPALAQLKPCPPTNMSKGSAACFLNETCCTAQYFGASGCEVLLPNGDKTCCAPGAALPISATLPNCLIIGDSVSDQYTPSVAVLLKDKCLVQHAPWVGGGSADNVANGLFNLLHCRWLRTALRPDLPVKWDVIQFVSPRARARAPSSTSAPSQSHIAPPTHSVAELRTSRPHERVARAPRAVHGDACKRH
jgi:hypothetical protein